MVNIVIGTFILKTFIFLTRYDADHNGLPVWDSADASGWIIKPPGPAKIGALQDEGNLLAISFESCKQCHDCEELSRYGYIR